jgi:hypothetical protein
MGETKTDLWKKFIDSGRFLTVFAIETGTIGYSSQGGGKTRNQRVLSLSSRLKVFKG